MCVGFSVMSDSVIQWTVIHEAPLSMEFSRKEYWTGYPFPSQGIFSIQTLNPGLLHCKQILYCLSHQGRPYAILTYMNIKNMISNIIRKKKDWRAEKILKNSSNTDQQNCVWEGRH